MLKILYISPENTVGILSYWKKAHELNGNHCRFVTFYRTAAGYEEDILLNLPFIASRPWYIGFRRWMIRSTEGRESYTNLEGYPPVWNPPVWQKTLWQIREMLWRPKINRTIREYDLEDFDVYHFEWGLDFYRNAEFARKMKDRGKKIICHFHGQDLRNRGVIPEMDAISDLNLTNELDLTYMHPNLNYLFLPYDVRAFDVKQSIGNPITICHATTNRVIKGSDLIIKTCQDLEKSHGIKFILVENQTHEKVIEFKRQSDIFIDHVGELTWGYGMNSLESLSMGVASATYLNDTYEKFIPDHPFINIRPDNIKDVLVLYIEHPELILLKGKEGREWVDKYHDYRNVIQRLYQYYRQIGVDI